MNTNIELVWIFSYNMLYKQSISNELGQKVTLKNDKVSFVKIKIGCKFALASPTQLAPSESPRAGTQQEYLVVAV